MGRVSGSWRVWEGAASQGASVTVGIALEPTVTRRGVPSAAAWRCGGRARSGAERRGAGGRARPPERGMGRELGEPERLFSSCRALSGNWPLGPGPPRGDASRGGERIPRRGWVCNVYLGLPQKSPGQLETAGGRIA